jgi:hypothetical protein
MICRACGGVCFDEEVGGCLSNLPRSISFFLFIASAIGFGVVYAFDGPGCGCCLLESWSCNTSNFFLIGILEAEAAFLGFMVSLFPVFSSWVGSLSSSTFSWLPSDSLVSVTWFGCGLSYGDFCAESFTLLMSIDVFCGIIFLLISFFVGFIAGSAFLLSVLLSLSPIFLFIIVILLFQFVVMIALALFFHILSPHVTFFFLSLNHYRLTCSLSGPMPGVPFGLRGPSCSEVHGQLSRTSALSAI